MLLADKRSEATRAAYNYDINRFFCAVSGRSADPGLMREFFRLERGQAISLVLRFKADLIRRGLSEATVNRNLAAIKSLVSFARRLDRCGWDLADVQGEKVQGYRDTSGVDEIAIKALLKTPNLAKLKGKRDYAILRLLWENALRRSEVVKCNIGDFDSEGRSLAILGKGRGLSKETISLSEKTTAAINDWLQARGEAEPGDPLFIALDNASRGRRMTGAGVAHIITEAGKAAGITKTLSPHRIRHSSITAALEHGADVRAVQKLSRHKNLSTLLLYDDSRKNYQKEVTNLLSALA